MPGLWQPLSPISTPDGPLRKKKERLCSYAHKCGAVQNRSHICAATEPQGVGKGYQGPPCPVRRGANKAGQMSTSADIWALQICSARRVILTIRSSVSKSRPKSATANPTSLNHAQVLKSAPSSTAATTRSASPLAVVKGLGGT